MAVEPQRTQEPVRAKARKRVVAPPWARSLSSVVPQAVTLGHQILHQRRSQKVECWLHVHRHLIVSRHFLLITLMVDLCSLVCAFLLSHLGTDLCFHISFMDQNDYVEK